MQTVIEEYVSCREQQINGIVYGINEAVPGAHVLRTLPALLRTHRLRLRSVVVTEPDPTPAEDIGSAQAVKVKRKTKRRAKASAKS